MCLLYFSSHVLCVVYTIANLLMPEPETKKIINNNNKLSEENGY